MISYNQLMEYLEGNTDTGQVENGLYKFRCIQDHRGPYKQSFTPLNWLQITCPLIYPRFWNVQLYEESHCIAWETKGQDQTRVKLNRVFFPC